MLHRVSSVPSYAFMENLSQNQTKTSLWERKNCYSHSKLHLSVDDIPKPGQTLSSF